MIDTLQKAVRVKINVGESGSVDELRELEKLFFRDMDLEKFTEKLTRFVTDEIVSTGVPGVEELRKIDDFVTKFYADKLAEAELWVVRGFVIGKLIEQAERLPVKPTFNIDKLPTKVADAVRDFKLTAREADALKWANTNGAKHLTDATADTIKRTQQVVFDGIQKRLTNREIRQNLEEEFMSDEGEVNRNWKRVAIQETNNAFNQAYLAQTQPGQWVVGMSMPDRCDACGHWIDGKVYPVIDAKLTADYSRMNKSDKKREEQEFLWENAVWLGKNNVGRSWSKKKRVIDDDGDAKLVEREHHELYVPAIPMHPYCRCRWVKINPSLQYVDGYGQMKMKIADPGAWQAWYNRVVIPQAEMFAKHGITLQTTGAK